MKIFILTSVNGQLLSQINKLLLCIIEMVIESKRCIGRALRADDLNVHA